MRAEIGELTDGCHSGEYSLGLPGCRRYKFKKSCRLDDHFTIFAEVRRRKSNKIMNRQPLVSAVENAGGESAKKL